MIAALLFVVFAGQGKPLTFPTFLSDFEKESSGEFATWKGFPSEFQRNYIAHRDSAKVAAEAKRLMDPQLWETSSPFGWHNLDGSKAEPCSIWSGRKGSIYEGWSLQINWNWGPIDPSQHGKPGERYGPAKGWTHITVHALCSRDDVPHMREMFQYLFGVP